MDFPPLKVECLQPLICGSQPPTTKTTEQSFQASDLSFSEQPPKSEVSPHSTINCLATPEGYCNDASPNVDGQEVATLAAPGEGERETSEERDYVFDGYESEEEEEEGEEEEEEEEEGEVEGGDQSSESDDEIEFSDESDDCGRGEEEKTPLDTPLVTCENKGPPRYLMTLFSEESGFGENSLSESYSDGDWEDEYWQEKEEEEEGCDMKGGLYWRQSDETWKQFVEQALNCSPSISPRCSREEAPSAVASPPALSHCPTTPHPAPAQAVRLDRDHPRSLPQCPLLDRLRVSHVCPERHRLCCQPTSGACSSAESSDTDCTPSPQTHRKRVSFVEDSRLAEIHHMVAWDYAYRSCRKGPWEQYARDRMHFRRRIDSVAGIIEPCLQKKLQCISSQS